MKLTRYSGNPIVKPNPHNKWESAVTTNPGVWYEKENKTVYLLYRGAGPEAKHTIHLGLATSKDGFHFTRQSSKPVFSPSENGFDAGCIEDARIVKFGEYYYITYACRQYPPGEYWLPEKKRKYLPPTCPVDFPVSAKTNCTSTGLAISKDFKTFLRVGRLTDSMLDDRDVILFPEKINNEYVLLHRPKEWVGPKYGTKDPGIWMCTGKDILTYGKSTLLAKARFPWEDKIGGSGPPIKTKQGWLTIYHAVGHDLKYRLGVMLLDLHNPIKILHRSPGWILEPTEKYELEGYYPGVVFSCGNIIINNTLFVYYGGADKYVGVATCKVSEMLQYLQSCPS